MNTERLLAHFDTISEAPDAVARLRRFILDLAVRGKLVEQDPGDEPAEELLGQIAEARFGLNHPAKRKKVNQIFIEPTDDPFELPNGWQWVRFTEVAEFSAGRTPSRSEDKYWRPGCFNWVSIGDMEDGRPLLATKEKVSRLAGEAVFRSEPEPIGTMIMSFKLTIGKIARLSIPAFHNEAIVSIRPCLAGLDSYLFKVIPIFAKSANSKGAIKGATLNRDSISRIPIPLPPLAEQHRIVAKVDELMALCDQLEASRQQREQTRVRWVAASLQRLNEPAEDPASFRQHATFALQTLPFLTTTPAQIKQLRQTILNLAVRGKLVEQDPEDQDKTARERLVEFAESCSLIPGSWLYVPLACLLAEDTRNGYSRKPDDAEDGFPILRISAATARPDGLVDEGEFKLISGIDEVLASQYAVQRGDLLACRFNGNKAYVGRLSLFMGYSGKQFIYPDKLIRVRLAEWLAEPAFFRCISNSDLVREEVEEKCATTVGNWGISAGKLKTCMFPIPPLAEQHRIVAKVDELMALCDQLEQQLSQADQQRRRLLEAVLAEALLEPQAGLSSAGAALAG